MRGVLFLLLLFSGWSAYAQQAYYKEIDFTLPPEQLYSVLQKKLEIYHTSYTYGEARDMMKVADRWSEDSSQVVLIYGFDDGDNDCTTDYTRNNTRFGGQSCQYNREHVFAKSLTNPPMGQSNNNTIGIAADPHNLRACDQRANQIRGNKRFGEGSGNARVIGNHWYPGDEWKGDVARMMMYMYVRYDERCLPSLVGEGPTQGSSDMLELFLKWNIEDPVSYLEIQRNDYIESTYGSRNPFIDNPYLATILWGGDAAEDTWGILNTSDQIWQESISVYQNPTSDSIWVESTTGDTDFTYTLYDLTGQEVLQSKSSLKSKQEIPTNNLVPGVYILNIQGGNSSVNRQVLVK